MFMPLPPDRRDVPGASSRALPPTVPPPVDGAAGGGGGGPPTAVRGVLRRLRREHARRAGPAGSPLGAAAGSPAGSAWLTGVPADAVDAVDAGRTTVDPLVGLLATLRAVTARHVCRMRGDGVRPEQMLVRVKACVREAMAAEGWHDPESVQALTARVVAWSIAAYYDADDGR